MGKQIHEREGKVMKESFRRVGNIAITFLGLKFYLTLEITFSMLLMLLF